MAGLCNDTRIQHVTDFILLGVLSGYDSGAPIRGSSIVGMLQGIRHFFSAAGAKFPNAHLHIRMLLKGITRLDPPRLHNAPVSFELLESCLKSIRFQDPNDQALWGGGDVPGVLLSLRRSEIVAVTGSTFKWFAIKGQDISVLNASGTPTRDPSCACLMHIRLHKSKTNQGGDSTARMLFRSGHEFLCPVFGALMLLQARKSLPLNIPAAVYMSNTGRPACVSTSDIAKVVKIAATQVSEGPRRFSSHSLRAEGATHMYRSDMDALTIQFHGRWPSDAFKIYTSLCQESISTLAAKMTSGSKADSTLHEWAYIAIPSWVLRSPRPFLD